MLQDRQDESEPLLEGSSNDEAEDHSLDNRRIPKSLRAVILPVFAGAVVNAVEKICYHPAVSAVALCCYSMVEPSIISAGQLLPEREQCFLSPTFMQERQQDCG